MFKVNCVIEPHYPVRAKFLRNTVAKILEFVKVKSKTEVTITIVGDRKMRHLNKEYAGVDETTNVLSFSQVEKAKGNARFIAPSSSEYLDLGDVVISYPQAIKDAIESEILVEEAIKKLLIHGLLHLFGYDHQAPEEQMAMRKLEDEIYHLE